MRKCYNAFVSDLEWDEAVDGAPYMLAWDADRRHSMNDYESWRRARASGLRQPLRDRLSYDKLESFWIDFDHKQRLPSAPKVPDCIQQPVELVHSEIKRRARALLPNINRATGLDLVRAVVEATAAVKATNVAAYWEHAVKAILVFRASEEMTYSWLSPGDPMQEPTHSKEHAVGHCIRFSGLESMLGT